MVNATAEIIKREMPKRWVPSLIQRVRAVEVKGGVKLQENPKRPSISHSMGR
jgi:hypothetical protein